LGAAKSIVILPKAPKVTAKPGFKGPRGALPGFKGPRGALPAPAARPELIPFVLDGHGRLGEHPAVPGHLNLLKSRMNALLRLRDLVHGPWPKDVSATEIKAGVDDAYARTASPLEAAVMRRYLALRARMEGRPDLAPQLLAPGERLNEKSVLRDLKILEEVGATPPPTSPLEELPLPEPEPISLKTPVREDLRTDLPNLLKDLPAAELRARRGAQRAIETSAGMHWNGAVIRLYNLKGFTAVDDSDDREAEVKRQLGQELKPEERLLVRRLLRTKKTAEVVAILRRMDGK
jgi:hypothetical protein